MAVVYQKDKRSGITLRIYRMVRQGKEAVPFKHALGKLFQQMANVERIKRSHPQSTRQDRFLLRNPGTFIMEQLIFWIQSVK